MSKIVSINASAAAIRVITARNEGERQGRAAQRDRDLRVLRVLQELRDQYPDHQWLLALAAVRIEAGGK